MEAAWDAAPEKKRMPSPALESSRLLRQSARQAKAAEMEADAAADDAAEAAEDEAAAGHHALITTSGSGHLHPKKKTARALHVQTSAAACASSCSALASSRVLPRTHCTYSTLPPGKFEGFH
ncbi:hypothetical protein BS78_02G093300 [Paspalum vaginatum]|nr:hypothetical protein BS78_02G093300 [Paspalum vaginatum]